MKYIKRMNESNDQMQKVVVYYACFNGGDGSVSLRWYLDGDTASEEEESQSEGWGEDCTGSVETFVGSDIHKQAVRNENMIKNSPERKLIDKMKSASEDELMDLLDNYFMSFNNNKDGVHLIRYKKEGARDSLISLCRNADTLALRRAIRNYKF